MVKQLMKISVWLAILIFGILGYIRFSTTKPCDSPIHYTIGAFDERFGISQKDFLATIQEAEDIWEKPISKNILEYAPEGGLTIHLIYDDRQKTTQYNQLIKTDLTKINELARSVKEQYLSLTEEYAGQKQDYGDMMARFKDQQDAYAEQVAYWNTHGGAPKDVYNKLILEKEELDTEYAALDKKRLALNDSIEQINTFIHKYNLLVNNANTNIETINRSAGREFEEGVYDPAKNEITIYEFSTPDKLLRVVTHELGHALGLPHNDNPESIMYALNQAATSVLSKDDIAALQARCVRSE